MLIDEWPTQSGWCKRRTLSKSHVKVKNTMVFTIIMYNDCTVAGGVMPLLLRNM